MANSLGEMEITMLNGKRMGMLNMKWEGSNSIAMERMTIWRLMQLRIYSLEESFYSCMVWNGVMNDWSISKRRRNEYFSGFWMSFQMPIQTQAAKVISAVWVVSFEMPIWIGNAKFECLFELRYRRCMHNLEFSAADFAAYSKLSGTARMPIATRPKEVFCGLLQYLSSQSYARFNLVLTHIQMVVREYMSSAFLKL